MDNDRRDAIIPAILCGLAVLDSAVALGLPVFVGDETGTEGRFFGRAALDEPSKAEEALVGLERTVAEVPVSTDVVGGPVSSS